MEAPATLTIHPAEWCADSERLLGLAMVHATTGDLKFQVESGKALLFQVIREQAGTMPALVGYYVLRVDETADGCEGVLVAAAGDGAGVDLTEAILPVIEKQFIGCRIIRIHTARPGLAKKLHAAGYNMGEMVLRKRLQ